MWGHLSDKVYLNLGKQDLSEMNSLKRKRMLMMSMWCCIYVCVINVLKCMCNMIINDDDDDEMHACYNIHCVYFMWYMYGISPFYCCVSYPL